MKILSIETSCDESAISLLEARDSLKPKFKVVANALLSQTAVHEEFGGVFPNLAKREHQKNLVPLLLKVLKTQKTKKRQVTLKMEETIKKILEREPLLLEFFLKHVVHIAPPKIDRIAVTEGPGLEPALWVGINFAKALSVLWNIPLFPANHMKGHFLASLAEGKTIEFPALALLISGGHTELALAKSPLSYKLIGETRDDAIGEAYDKVARILGLPYPGGPHIARLAEKARKEKRDSSAHVLPRPMLNSKDLDFSFSGLKTAVLYMTQKISHVDESVKEKISKEFEESAKDVLVKKTEDAILKMKPKTLVVGGGVSANGYIKKNLEKLSKKHGVKFLVSSKNLATDNAIMIAIAGFFAKRKPLAKIVARGNLTLED